MLVQRRRTCRTDFIFVTKGAHDWDPIVYEAEEKGSEVVEVEEKAKIERDPQDGGSSDKGI